MEIRDLQIGDKFRIDKSIYAKNRFTVTKAFDAHGVRHISADCEIESGVSFGFTDKSWEFYKANIVFVNEPQFMKTAA